MLFTRHNSWDTTLPGTTLIKVFYGEDTLKELLYLVSSQLDKAGEREGFRVLRKS
jgi:hypothetical protein